MKTEEKLDLIKRGISTILGEDELKTLLETNEEIVVSWGIAPTGFVHIGYLIPLTKIINLLNAGIRVKVLIADIHAFLDARKTPWNLKSKRSRYYQAVLESLLQGLDKDPRDIDFIVGSTFQKSEGYVKDLYKLSAKVPAVRAREAGSEVIRQEKKISCRPKKSSSLDRYEETVDSLKVGGLLYPIMQSLDIHYLGADIILGGTDQRGIYALAKGIIQDVYPEKKPVILLNELLPSLNQEGKMSASSDSLKINCDDTEEVLRTKINKARCPEGILKDNPIIILAEQVIFPWLQRQNKRFTVTRESKYGGNIHYKTSEELINDFFSRKLHPADLKNSTSDYLNTILAPVRKRLEDEKSLLVEAFPS